LILFDWAQTHGTGDLLDDKEKDEKKAKVRMNVGEGMHWDDKEKDEKKARERMNVGEGMHWDDKEKDEKEAKEWNECLGPEFSWMITRKMKRRAKTAMNVWDRSVYG
jgi:hypothetical protein